MPESVDDVLAILQKISNEMEAPKEIDLIRYREDYQDYQLILKDETRCEIREKLVDNMEKDLNLDDTIREIQYLICNSVQLEEWEKEDLGLKELDGDDSGPDIDI